MAETGAPTDDGAAAGPIGRIGGGTRGGGRIVGTAGEPRAPDFSAIALEHLAQRCDAFRQHVREHLERPAAEAPLTVLSTDLQRFRNTLVLLERTGAVFVAEELLALLEARAEGGIDDEDAFARVLVSAGEQLGDHVARLGHGAGGEGALSLLPLVNDSRACRGASLLSEALLLAAGIDVPAHPDAPLDAGSAGSVDAFVARALELRPALGRALRAWLDTGEPRADAPGAERAGVALSDEPVRAFDELAGLCDGPALAPLAPLFEAATVLLEAIRDGEVVDGEAPRGLFERLVHWLDETLERGEAERTGLPDAPDALYRDLLYYVALIDPREPRVASLHRRFELGRIRPALTAAARHGTETVLGERLSEAIRDSLDLETSTLRQWLDQAPTAADHPHVLRLRERLARLEPVLTLLGARDARSWLRRINDTLGALSTDAPVGAAERLMLAESLIRLDRALDEAAAPPARAAPGEPSPSRAAAPDIAEVAPGVIRPAFGEPDAVAERRELDEALASCLQEARRRLISVGESLDAPRLVGAAAGDAELLLVERVLTLLAVPDVGPLLRGVRAVNARIDPTSPPAVRDTLATLLASLEFYLGCLLRRDDGAPRLLHDAEEALARLEARLPPLGGGEGGVGGRADTAVPARQGEGVSAGEGAGRAPGIDRPPPRRETEHAPRGADDTAALEGGEGGRLTREALSRMDAIGEALAGGAEEGVDVAPLRASFAALAEIGARGGLEGMRELAGAALHRLERVGDGRRLPSDELALIEEAHAVLPQLIEQVHGTSERVRGLDALVRELDGGAPESSATSARSAPPDDDDLLDDSALTLDDTLQQVFRRECAMHIDTLEQAVAIARRAAGGEGRLPSDAMLRALHTLSGSAQTVDARDIVAVVQPLQRVALARQRVDVAFDEAETRYVGELVEVLRARLEALESGAPVDPSVHAVEAALPGFVERAQAVRGGERRARADERSLEQVFDEEARELLARLQRAIAPESDAATGTDRALGHLHTLKGSARMAGRTALAERAHALEGLVQGMPGAEARRRALSAGRRELQTLLLDTASRPTSRPAPSTPPARAVPDEASGRDPGAGASGRPSGEAVPEPPPEPPPGRLPAPPLAAPGAQPGTASAAPLAGASGGAAGIDSTDRIDTVDASDAIAEEAAAEHGERLAAARNAAHDAASVPAATFESLLTLATDVTVSQARLSDDIARVREVCRDLESAAGRWRRLPHEAPLLESPAAREMLADLDTARRGLSDALRLADVEQQHASRAASTLQQTLIRTRLVRVEDLRERLDEAVRDAAAATSREARFTIEGGEVTLDGALCRQLRAPLEHLVRNAVVHGIETPETRRRAGKDGCGTVRLTAALDGTELVLAIDDDGAGIDRAAVSRRREAAGHPRIDTVDALRDVLCEAGFTTLDEAGPVGGRGLGLSAVGETLSRLDGRLHIGTRTGAGTTVTCRLRQRIVVNQVVLVSAARRLYALPVGAVQRVGTEEGGAGRGSVRHSLLTLLGAAAVPASRGEGETDDTGAYADGSAELAVEVDGRASVLEVDRVLGYRELLVQPLGPQLATLQCYAGGSVLPDGRQVLLVELERLLGAGTTGAGAARSRPDPETLRPVALVVDDSITLRVAAAGMLERSGVESREARDGIEALDSLARALPDLMIVDIDMPRLGGFDLIRRMRERHAERSPPVVVISSREGEADRERAAALGVVRYLSKPYSEEELREALLASGLRLPDLTIA